MVAHSAARFSYTKATRAQRMICKRSVPASVAGPCTKQSRKGKFIPGQGTTECPAIPPVRGRERLGWDRLQGHIEAKGYFRKSHPLQPFLPSQAPQEPSSAVFPGKTEVTVFLFNTALYCEQYLGASIAPSAQLERKHTLAQECML